MRRLLALICLAAVMMSATSCASRLGTVQPPPASASIDKSVFDTRLFYNKCVLLTTAEEARGEAFPLAALGAAVLPSLISTTLDRFGQALRRAGEAETTSISASLNIEVEPDQEKLAPCVQFVRGWFLDEASGVPDSVLKGMTPQELNRVKDRRIYLAEAPHFFLELRLRRSANGEAVAYAPSYLVYNRLLKDGSEAMSHRGLAVQFSIHKPGKPADDDSAVGAPLTFGNLEIGTARRYLLPDTSQAPYPESQWFPSFIPVSPQAASLSSAVPAPPPPAVPSPSSAVPTPPPPAIPMPSVPAPPISVPTMPTKHAAPLTATLTVAEVRDANKFLLFLADVFEGSKENLQTLLETQLIKEKRDAAKLEAATQQQENLSQYYTDFADAEIKYIEWCNANKQQDAAGKKDRLAKSKEAHVAQLKANLSAQKARLSQPYSTLVPVGDAIASCP